MKKFLLISFMMLIPASLQADKIVKPKEPPKTENSEEKSDEKPISTPKTDAKELLKSKT